MRLVAGAGFSRLDPMVSLGLAGFLEDLLFLGLLWGVEGSGLQRTPGLSPRDPREGVAGMVFLTTFLGGVVTPWGERVRFFTYLVFGPSVLSSITLLLSSLSSLHPKRSKDALGG